MELPYLCSSQSIIAARATRCMPAATEGAGFARGMSLADAVRLGPAAGASNALDARVRGPDDS